MAVTRARRDATCRVVMNDLTGIGDVWLAVEEERLADAERLGRALREDLRLLHDLGWS